MRSHLTSLSHFSNTCSCSVSLSDYYNFDDDDEYIRQHRYRWNLSSSPLDYCCCCCCCSCRNRLSFSSLSVPLAPTTCLDHRNSWSSRHLVRLVHSSLFVVYVTHATHVKRKATIRTRYVRIIERRRIREWERTLFDEVTNNACFFFQSSLSPFLVFSSSSPKKWIVSSVAREYTERERERERERELWRKRRASTSGTHTHSRREDVRK